MKKVLWSIAAAAFTFVLVGCANTVELIPSENCPSQLAVRAIVKVAEPVEIETSAFSASDEQAANDITVNETAEISPEPKSQAEPSAVTHPQESKAPVQVSLIFVADTKKETLQSSFSASISSVSPRNNEHERQHFLCADCR